MFLDREKNLSNKVKLPETRRYFDYQATTPMDPRVLDAMLPYTTSMFGNPHSRSHSYGWESEKAVDKGRKQIADVINADPTEIIITSGATESDNIAIKGVAEFYNNNLHIISTQAEHKAVLNSLRNLEEKGVEVTYLPLKKDGSICLEKLKKSIKPNTKLITIMTVNNELGTISPIEEIGKICKEKDILFHTDAAQSFGKIPADVKKDNIALMSISSHKIYGPKGVGALYVRKNPRVRLVPQMSGGGQERSIRSGTTPSFLVAGFGKAAEIAKREMTRDLRKVKELNSRLYNKLKEKLGQTGIIKNGLLTIPHCLNISFPHIEGEGLLMKLKNFALSSGSACTSASLEPSYVLRALGTSDELAHSSIRFGLGRFTTKEDVDKLADTTVSAVEELREMSPLYEMVKDGVDLSNIKWTA